jgi:hypothetical protein
MTLIEVLMSLSILAVIAVALTGVMSFAARVLPRADSAANEGFEINQTLVEISHDIAEATAIQEIGISTIRFTVPDRNNDAAPETIEYSWDGTAGNGLRRIVNGSVAGNMIDKISDFSVAVQTESRTRSVPGPNRWSGTELLGSHTAPGNKQYTVKLIDGPVAFTFRPVLPADAVNWAITRVEFQATLASSYTPEIFVGVHPVNGFGSPNLLIPISTDFVNASAGTKTTPYWFAADFNANAGFARDVSAAIVFSVTSSTRGLNVWASDAVADDSVEMQSYASFSWSKQPAEGPVYRVYGIVERATTTDEVYDAAVGISIALSLTSGQQASTNVRLLNQPEAP